MNLTKWFAAGLCITAMTVSAQSIKTNSFEGTLDSTGWFVGVDKNLESTGIVVANDAINNRDTYSSDATNRPMPDAANTKVLKLDESVTFTNTIADASFELAPVYVDMLVKFVPSDTLATVDSTAKLAIAVTNNLLAVTRYNSNQNEWVITGTTIDTSVWHRVTVKLEYEDPMRYATVIIDNSPVSVGEVSRFRITDNQGYALLQAISFSGTGYIDEIVVTKDDPFGSTVVDLTLDFSTGIQSVYVGGNAKNTTDKVPSGSELVITAKNWYEIASVTGPATTTYIAGAVGSTVATVKVENATATNVTITGRTSTSTAKVSGSTSFTNQPMNKVAAWANGVGSLTGDVTEPMYNKYLLNIASTADVPTMLIKSISVSGTVVTIQVEAGAITNFKTDVPGGINGTLKIKSYATLGGDPTIRTITFVEATTDTVTCDIDPDSFVKATVE